MNRSFITPLTPQAARLTLSMARHAVIKIDQQIIDCAEINRVTDQQFADNDIEKQTDRRAVQFIIDTNFRAGLPTPARYRDRRESIIAAALKISNEEFLCARNMRLTERDWGTGISTSGGLKSCVSRRNTVVVASLDAGDEITETFMKFFPRVILHGDVAIQHAFAFGSNYSSASRMCELLYPSIANNIKKPHKKSDLMSILSCACFPDFLSSE